LVLAAEVEKRIPSLSDAEMVGFDTATTVFAEKLTQRLTAYLCALSPGLKYLEITYEAWNHLLFWWEDGLRKRYR